MTALVPDGEYFDSTALNEGIWLTAGHVNAIEQALEGNAGTITQLTGERDTARQELAAANTAATQATNDLATANSTITAQQAEIATLKKGPASAFTNTTSGEDPETGKKAEVPFHASDENPANQLADRLFGKPSGQPKP